MNLSLQEKSLWISLVLTLLIFGYYFSHAVRTIRNPDVDDMILVGFIIGVIVLSIIIQIILQSVLAIAHRKEVEDGGDERDNLSQ